MVRRVALGGLLFVLAVGAGLSFFSVEGLPRSTTSDSAPLRLNDLQVLGSHNSYKAAIYSSLMQILRQRWAEPPGILCSDGGRRASLPDPTQGARSPRSPEASVERAEGTGKPGNSASESR